MTREVQAPSGIRWRRRVFIERAALALGCVPLLPLFGCGDAHPAGGQLAGGLEGAAGDGGGEPAQPVFISDGLRDAMRQRVGARALEASFGEGDLGSLQQLGKRYLDQERPAGMDDAVRALLAPTLERIESASSDDDALAALRDAIDEEFARRDVIDLSGWTLAPTELSLAALLWLVRDVAEPREDGRC